MILCIDGDPFEKGSHIEISLGEYPLPSLSLI